MKKMNTLLIAAMAFGVAGTAVASTTCHRILAIASLPKIMCPSP